ncbi:MAG: PEP-CTERM sorting domain-containing protein, partial [Planctomycetales bacterium]|nr:PEP-CTERM sorting domain-containing protein [Planctomycetales bacterium]
NGYNGTFDRRIGERDIDEQDGNTVAAYFLDGYAPSSSPDTQALLRFDGIIGSSANQIPAGATILDAKLTLTTSLAGNAQTSGPYGVAGLNQAFDSNTSYFVDFTTTTDFGSRGPWWEDGYATRPVGGYGFQLPGAVDKASVTSLVQGWADGSPNYGMVVQAGFAADAASTANTSDGWSIRTTGFPNGDSRPLLEVEYTTAPVTKTSFQQGANGYSSTTMAVVRSGANALIEDALDGGEITEDGTFLDQTFLDGVFYTDTAGNTSSPDDLALLKFENIFGNGAGQAPANTPVAKAWAVITTGDQSNAAQSSGPWSAHTVLRDWDLNTLHSDFGAVNGLQVGDGDISPALDTLDGFVRGSEVWFDVTDYVEGVRSGDANYGIAIRTTATADGWQINATGSSNVDARPRLVVFSADLGIISGTPGDFNDDGSVDGSDFLLWQQGLGGSFDDGDFAAWSANFGSTPASLGQAASTAIPEPTGVLMTLLGAFGLGLRRRR